MSVLRDFRADLVKPNHGQVRRLLGSLMLPIKREEDLYELLDPVIEGPKGTYTFVAVCGYSKFILGPPNYHGYQKILKLEHAALYGDIPFDQFRANIKIKRDEASVRRWLDLLLTPRRAPTQSLAGVGPYNNGFTVGQRMSIENLLNAAYPNTSEPPGVQLVRCKISGIMLGWALSAENLRRRMEALHATLFPNLDINAFLAQLELTNSTAKTVVSSSSSKESPRSPQTIAALHPDTVPTITSAHNPLKPASIIVDVANVCGTLCRDDPQVAFKILLTILLEFHREGLTYLCLTESKMFGFWKKNGLEAQARQLQHLVDSFPEFFSHIHTGEADQFILDTAQQAGCRILSNDQYYDYRERYVWVQPPKSDPEGRKLLKGAERVLVCSIVQNRVSIPAFQISATIVRNVNAAFAMLCKVLVE